MERIRYRTDTAQGEGRQYNQITKEIKETEIVEAGNLSYNSVFPWHEPYGTGIGAQPGRVVWAYDPLSADWDGEGYWWDLSHFDETAIQRLVNEGIAKQAGETDVQAGWDNLFRAHNAERGYQA